MGTRGFYLLVQHVTSDVCMMHCGCQWAHSCISAHMYKPRHVCGGHRITSVWSSPSTLFETGPLHCNCRIHRLVPAVWVSLPVGMLGLQMCLDFCRFWGFKFNFLYLSSKCRSHWAIPDTHATVYCSFWRGSQDMHVPWQTQWSVAVGSHSHEQIPNTTETPACPSILSPFFSNSNL